MLYTPLKPHVPCEMSKELLSWVGIQMSGRMVGSSARAWQSVIRGEVAVVASMILFVQHMVAAAVVMLIAAAKMESFMIVWRLKIG